MLFPRVILAFFVGTWITGAQGTVNFTTRSGTLVNAPVFYYSGIRVMGTGPDAVLGQLYGGPIGSALSPIGSPVPFRSDAGRGYITAGGEVSIPGTTPGGEAQVKLVAWLAEAGNSYTEAMFGTRCGAFGESQVILVHDLGGGGPPPAFLAGLQGFDAFPPCPEPSIPVLGLLGASLLLIRRKSGKVAAV